MIMEIIHDFSNTGISRKSGKDNFLLSNGLGGYASLSGKNISKYQGIYFHEKGDFFKVVENILIPGAIKGLKNKFTSAIREREDVEEFFYMPKNLNSFVYEVSSQQEISIILDCRNALDFRKWGRHYRFYHKEGMLFVKYTKKSHNNEDKEGNSKQYEIYVAIVPDNLDYSKTGKWEKAEYEFDKRRNDDSEIYVYNALKINASRLVFGFGTSEESAIENVVETLNLNSFKENPDVRVKFIMNNEVHMAYLCAQDALNKLHAEIDGIKGFFAGLPWFNHFWSRDELISLGALLILKKYNIVKDIIMRYIELVQEDGRLPNRYPATKLENADSVGWLFKRTYDLLVKLFAKNKLYKYFTKEELHDIKHALERSIQGILQNYSEGELIISKEQETWYDTKPASRSGKRIEIQALQLSMYRCLRWISGILNDKQGKAYAIHKEKQLKNEVRKNFWNGHYLKDGSEDNTIRPNIFIAHYVYPELLSSSEWRKCFDNALPRLFTGFGLSSIDMHSTRFHAEHTGSDDLSYHQGDSWYWINNLAAVCLFRVGKFKYAKYLNGILKGSTRDILWTGVPGCASEISSASNQEALGCFNQAWSNSTYIEMINEMF